jgi:hypothetical protein
MECLIRRLASEYCHERYFIIRCAECARIVDQRCLVENRHAAHDVSVSCGESTHHSVKWGGHCLAVIAAFYCDVFMF